MARSKFFDRITAAAVFANRSIIKNCRFDAAIFFVWANSCLSILSFAGERSSIQRAMAFAWRGRLTLTGRIILRIKNISMISDTIKAAAGRYFFTGETGSFFLSGRLTGMASVF